MRLRNIWSLSAGRPVVCCTFASVLLVLSAPGRAALSDFYGWYVLAFGIAYAGRLPIHLIRGRYACRRPRKETKPGLRVRLNILVAANAASIAIWIAIGLMLLGEGRPPGTVLAVAMSALWMAVLGLGVLTVRCVSDLELKRGTELVCESRVGQLYLDHYSGAPENSDFGRFLQWFRRKTPAHQISAFLLLVAGPLLAVPSAAATAHFEEEMLAIRVGSPPLAESKPQPPGSSKTQSPSLISIPRSRTYAEECPGSIEPGYPATEPFASELNSLWMGGKGIDGAGAVQAGCAQTAVEVSAEPEVWTEEGRCGTALRSLGVAADGYLPALLYEQAAAFAIEKAHEGVLLGASERHRLSTGDFYIIDTQIGSYVLIRASLGGPGAAATGERPCERIGAQDAPYSVVPPGLIGVWAELVGRAGWLWPVQAGSDHNRNASFIFRPSVGGPIRGSASCSSDTSCVGEIDGKSFATGGSVWTTVTAVESLAP